MYVVFFLAGRHYLGLALDYFMTLGIGPVCD